MNTPESRRKNKWMAGGAVLVLLLAIGSIGRLFYLQRQAAPRDLKAQAAAINARLALTPAEQARRLELVTHLRDTWRPWAEKHQGELRRMLNASPSDTAARDTVVNAIPFTPSLSAGSKALYEALNVHGDGEKGEVFTWNAISRARVSRGSAMTVDDKDRFGREIASYNWNVKNDFSEQRDVVISQSIQTGKISVSLWASGRVTENTFDNREIRSSEGFGLPTYKRKELLPPYEFLTSKL